MPSNMTQKLHLEAADGACAVIYSHGAHLTSWVPAQGGERLFLSAASEFRRGAAIRGGVPIIFPQFAAEGPLTKHGFARITDWKLADMAETPAGLRTARFELSDNPETRALWPYSFLAEYVVSVGGSLLKMNLQITNVGTLAFDFTVALHTYLRVGDVGNVVIPGLQGVQYRDSAQGNVLRVEEDVGATIRGEVDRIYFDAPAELSVVEPDRTLLVRSQGFVDTVVWNPGPEKGAALKDMERGGYRHMLCIEAAAVGKPIHLKPGQKWSGLQELHV